VGGVAELSSVSALAWVYICCDLRRSLTLLELRRVTDAGIAAVAELHLPVLKRVRGPCGGMAATPTWSQVWQERRTNSNLLQ
jgi:hypothetical protein